MSIETTSHARSLAIVKPGLPGTRTKSPLARRTGLWPSTASQHSPISTSPKPAKSIRERRTAQRPAPWITFVPTARGRGKVITSASGSTFRTVYNALWTPYYGPYGLACARSFRRNGSIRRLHAQDRYHYGRQFGHRRRDRRRARRAWRRFHRDVQQPRGPRARRRRGGQAKGRQGGSLAPRRRRERQFHRLQGRGDRSAG